jgi:hypothetical protein
LAEKRATVRADRDYAPKGRQGVAIILNKLREGYANLSAQDKQWLQEHLVKHWKFEDEWYSKLKPHQFSTNKQVDTHNHKATNYTQGETIQIPATDRVCGWHTQKVGDGHVIRNVLRATAAVDRHEAKNLHAVLRVKVGSRVEIGDTFDQQTSYAMGTMALCAR